MAKYNKIIGVGAVIFIISLLIMYELGVAIPPHLYFALLAFVVVGGIILYFSQSTTERKFASQEETINIVNRIYYLFNKKGAFPCQLGDLLRATYKYYEGVNRSYKAFVFERIPSTTGSGVVVVWDCQNNDIADVDFQASSERLDYPFYGFDPFEGKYRPPVERRKVTHIHVRKKARTKLKDSTGEEEEEVSGGEEV